MITHAFTLRPYFAWAVERLGKDVENRTKAIPRKHVGRWVALHAGIELAPSDLSDVESRVRLPRERLFHSSMPRTGGVIGAIRFTDDGNSDSLWAMPGHLHWRIANLATFETVPCGGQLGFWTLREHHAALVNERFDAAMVGRSCGG